MSSFPIPTRATRLVALLSSLSLAAACGDNGAEPDLVIVSPATGDVLLAPEATLVFRVEDAPANAYTVTIGDAEPVTMTRAIAVDEEVSLPLVLASGVNTIAVTVAGAGNTGDEETLVLVVETDAAPVVELTTPSPTDTTYATTAAVTGRIVAPRPITTATATVGSGAPVALELAPTAGGYTFTGEVALELGDNALAIDVADDRDQHATAAATITRLADTTAPEIAIDYPRDGQAVRTRRVLVRGHATDQSSVDEVTLSIGGQTVTATLAADGSFSATVDVAPALGELTATASDGFGNSASTTSHVYYGQRLAAGGSHGGAIWNDAIYTWGRNNLGQTGLDYVSHENRTAYCDRSLTATGDIAQCKATTLNAIDAICLNPGFVTPAPTDSPEAAACRDATRTRRDAVCDAAGASAPNNCKTSGTANLSAACDTAYGAATPAGLACKIGLVCDGAYAAGSPEHASCAAVVGAVPTVYPSPATPYAPVAIARFSPTAAPPAAPGTGVAPDTLGVTFTSLSFNQNASSALDSAGRVWSWGDGANGMLCLGDTLARQIPHRVDEFGEPGTTAIAIARGYDHILILRSDGSVWGCGMNNVGQLGDGTSGTSRLVPTRVLGLPANIIQVAASSQSSYAVTADGEVYAWGRNQYGNLGDGTASSSTTVAATPALVPGVTGAVMLANGRDHVLVATADGTVFGWGLNASNQIDGSDGNVLSPVQIAGITDARGVYANGNQGFYEDPQGRLWGWGQNGSGNLGIPEDDDQPAPSAPVFGISGVLDVAIGALHGFAMRGDQVFGWGWSFHGSLGAGTSAIHTWPYRTPLVVQLP